MKDLFIEALLMDYNAIAEHSYVRKIPALKQLSELTFHKHITCFTGENGSGKSTLLEAIAIAYGFNPEGGTKNYHFSTLDTHSDLYEGIRLKRGWKKPEYGYFLRAESFYNVASKAQEYESNYLGKDLHHISHGESFLTFVQSAADAIGLYLLDEPEAALSPQRQLTLLLEMMETARLGSQFIIATHSPILLGIPDIEILSFDDGEIHPIAYEETQSYQITSMFVNHREYFLKKLLEED